MIRFVIGAIQGTKKGLPENQYGNHMAVGKVAILNLLGDYGFNTYNHELAEGLGQAGIDVVLFTCGQKELFEELPEPVWHKREVMLGSFLFRQKGPFQRRHQQGAAKAASGAGVSTGEARRPLASTSFLNQVRQEAMNWELLIYLWIGGFQWLWTQWPGMAPYGESFRNMAKLLGFKLVHTVHNVLPHEVKPGDREQYGLVYDQSDVLFVHSEMTRSRLRAEFPEVPESKIHMHRLGLFTVYPRQPDARIAWRNRLAIRPEQVVWLVCGLIRPYKNVDLILEAMQAEEFKDTILIVQGKESGFPGVEESDPLGYTRKKARELEVEDRVRWVPGFLSISEMGELFECADGLLLPYREGYGSALLSLGLAFGLHLVCAPVGGASEYLDEFGRGTLLAGCEAEDIRKGMAAALPEIRIQGGLRESSAPESLTWRRAGERAAEALAKACRK